METTETISFGSRAQQRVYVLTHLLAGALSVDEAAAVLWLSTRQADRLVDRYRDEGAAALVHGNRGRAPVNGSARASGPACRIGSLVRDMGESLGSAAEDPRGAAASHRRIRPAGASGAR